MVGLSIVLESTTGQKGNSQVINKSSIVKKPPIMTSTGSGFLDYCSLCRRKILPANDIYMYKGDRAFCSEECRCRQIFMDEEDDDVVCSSRLKENCGFAAGATSSSGGSRKGARNRGGGGGANGSAY